MNVLTLPRSIAALEYKALRLPATLLQSQVVVRFLDEESTLRLGFERTLGALDEKAGALLANDTLSERGRVLRHRAEVLTKAAELEEVAEQRAQSAEAIEREGVKKAQQTRDAARQQQQASVQAAIRTEQERKERAEQDAQAKARAEQERIAAQAEAKVKAVAKQVTEQETQITAAERRRTAAPKAQLEGAVALQQIADDERAQAERLAQLAAAEKQSRKAARS